MTVKTLTILVIVILGYASSTWLLFGAVHPCEILIVRQKDHHNRLAEKHHQADLELLKEVAHKTFPAKDYERFVKNLEEYSNVSLREENQKQLVLVELRQKIREMTPAQCAWQAVIWPPPVSAH